MPLLVAVGILLANTYARLNPAVSEWLSYICIGLSISALFVYGITFGMKLRR